MALPFPIIIIILPVFFRAHGAFEKFSKGDLNKQY